MFQLRYLECRDFFSFENMSIRFTKGMTLVTGYDEDGKDSNGSGKSTILNAICWALFGRTMKGVQGQDVVRWGCKDCVVILVLESAGHVYEIKRSVGNLKFTIDRVGIRGHYRDIQSAIETTFKTNYTLFIRSTAFSQSQVEFLAASGDAEKKKLFKEILSLSRLDKAYELARSKYDVQYRRAERLEGDIEAAQWHITTLEKKITDAERLEGEWEKNQQAKIETLKAKTQRPPKDTQIIKDSIWLYQQQLKDFEGLEEDTSNAEKDLSVLAYDDDYTFKEIRKLEDSKSNGLRVGEKCVNCGNVIKEKMLVAHHREIQKQIDELKLRRETVNKEKIALAETLKYYYALRSDKENIRLALIAAENDLALAERDWEFYRQTCATIEEQIKEIESDTNPYAVILRDLRTEFGVSQFQLDAMQKDFAQTTKSIDTLAFVKFALSREGAVGHIIEREYATLVSYSNRMLNTISGGTLRLSISPQRELKSGALKEEIDIIAYVKDKKTTYWGLSDGQRQRINIALLLALNKLCKVKGVNSFDFLLLDEVLDISLAEGGQQDVLELLKNYLRECQMIILISHKEAFKMSFNSCVSVYRDASGISRLQR